MEDSLATNSIVNIANGYKADVKPSLRSGVVASM